ncbi:nucleoside triphosphate pyrophosphohydrolase family protein [Candidatus Berkelbacteria bacterium]|nr:nucleoside triphosphate pyrophosphohydrolase family protein [Candidatus Berkelbacteria bacterium]
MTLDDYQQRAWKTAIHPNAGQNLVYPTLGLAGEAGEVANKVKKIMRDDGGTLTDTKRSEIQQELGDVLWYTAAIATELGLSLGTVAEENLNRLADRQARGVLRGSGDNR